MNILKKLFKMQNCEQIVAEYGHRPSGSVHFHRRNVDDIMKWKNCRDEFFQFFGPQKIVFIQSQIR